MDAPSAQSPVASSSTLWAQASKEWVIPPKPKPGRKPKKDSAATTSQTNDVIEESDSKGRRVQNRAAQRAFRERKQSQLAELQARLQSYEQGEIERNVALQSVSKRLKEENDVLRQENATLKEEIARLKMERERCPNKRWRDDSAGVLLDPPAPPEAQMRKRLRVDTDSPAPMGQFTQGSSFMSSPSSLTSSPESHGGSLAPFSPLPYIPAPSTAASFHHKFNGQDQACSQASQATPASSAFSRAHKPFESNNTPALTIDIDCGLCNENTPCVCREFLQQAQAELDAGISSQDLQMDAFADIEHEQDQKPPIEPAVPVSEGFPSLASATASTDVVMYTNENPNTHGSLGVRMADLESRPAPLDPTPSVQHMSATSAQSILDNLPAYQPSVPLRVRRNQNKADADAQSASTIVGKGNPTLGTIFQIQLPSADPPHPAEPHAQRRSAQDGAPSSSHQQTRVRPGATGSASAGPSSGGAVCSGDPSNCPACKDDEFGKAFCRALGDSVCSTYPCATCPSSASGGCGSKGKSISTWREAKHAPPNLMLQTNPLASATDQFDHASTSRAQHSTERKRSLSASSAHSNATNATAGSAPASASSPGSGVETIPTSDAWRVLKSHPHIAFADLSMLADVVARRTKCTGPTAVIHPALGSLTPERTGSPPTGTIAHAHSRLRSHTDPGVPPNVLEDNTKDTTSIVLTDPHARYRDQQHVSTNTTSQSGPTSTSGSSSSMILGPGSSNPPSLVPQEELRQCGRARLREVDAAGVREALRILDAQFGRR